MKNILLILLIGTCSCSKKTLGNKEIYIEEYKFKYYTACLKYGFDNSPEINKLLSEDKGGYGEPVLGTNYMVIDSLAKSKAKAMFNDSVKSAQTLPENKQGKRVFEKCLCDYNSKWLKTRATSAYRLSEK